METTSVIPNSVLEETTCIQCDKYLTVGPIGANADGGNICGRCLYEEDAPQSLFAADELNEQTIPLPILGYINHLFPCVNRFGGCKELLPLRDIRNHEQTCKSAKMACKNCKYEGVGSQLLQHFRKAHSHLVDQTCFNVDLKKDFETTYLFRKDDSLVFVDMYFEVEKTRIVFNYRVSGESELGLCFSLIDQKGKIVEHVPFTATYVKDKNQYCHVIVFTYDDEPFEKGNFSCTFEVQFQKKQKFVNQQR